MLCCPRCIESKNVLFSQIAMREELSQIQQLMLDSDFEKSLTDLERQTWLSVKAVINNFSGDTKSRNYKHWHYATELSGNESEHVTKDSHSSFSLGLLARKNIFCKTIFIRVFFLIISGTL